MRLIGRESCSNRSRNSSNSPGYISSSSVEVFSLPDDPSRLAILCWLPSSTPNNLKAPWLIQSSSMFGALSTRWDKCSGYRRPESASVLAAVSVPYQVLTRGTADAGRGGAPAQGELGLHLTSTDTLQLKA